MQERLANTEHQLSASSERIEALEEDLKRKRFGPETVPEVDKDEEIPKMQAELEKARTENERLDYDFEAWRKGLVKRRREAGAEHQLSASSERIEALEEDLKRKEFGPETVPEVDKDEEIQRVHTELEEAQARTQRCVEALVRARGKATTLERDKNDLAKELEEARASNRLHSMRAHGLRPWMALMAERREAIQLSSEKAT